MLDIFLHSLDGFGTAVFAVTGALTASRKRMDITGFMLLAAATGIGGGSVRDVMLGALPVFWVREPAYLITCVLVSCATFFLAHIPQSRLKLLLWCDAVGMALFAVTGAEKALLAGAAPIVAVAMGVITATFGGVVRDILGGESPVILSREIYVSAALGGAVIFVALALTGIAREYALAGGFWGAFAIRAAALRWDWSLPRYRPRPGRTREEIDP